MYVLGLISQFNLAWSSLTVALLTTFASIKILRFIVFCCHSVPHVLSLLPISSCSLNTSFPSSQSCPPDPSPAHADSRCSLTLLPLRQVPLICTNVHLQPTIEALCRVGTLLIQPAVYQRLGSGHGWISYRGHGASEAYLKSAPVWEAHEFLLVSV